jgi:hypothetical protein
MAERRVCADWQANCLQPDSCISKRCTMYNTDMWGCRLGTYGEAFSGAGPYDPVKRLLILEGINRGVAAAPGSSVWNGLFWTPSSIAILNAALYANGDYEVHFNEVGRSQAGALQKKFEHLQLPVGMGGYWDQA